MEEANAFDLLTGTKGAREPQAKFGGEDRDACCYNLYYVSTLNSRQE